MYVFINVLSLKMIFFCITESVIVIIVVFCFFSMIITCTGGGGGGGLTPYKLCFLVGPPSLSISFFMPPLRSSRRHYVFGLSVRPYVPFS